MNATRGKADQSELLISAPVSENEGGKLPTPNRNCKHRPEACPHKHNVSHEKAEDRLSARRPHRLEPKGGLQMSRVRPEST